MKKAIHEYGAILSALLSPDDMCETVEEIPVKELYQEGYRTFLLDVDNTLMTYEQREPSLQKIQWVDSLKSQGFNVYLISNNLSYKRIRRVAVQLGVLGIYFACKPFTMATRDFITKHHIDPASSIVVGDQLLKDVILANWLGMYAVLVNPLDIRKSFFKTVQRDIEMSIIQKII